MTSYDDVVPPSSGPVTYIYYVRTIDQGETSARGPWDHATTATLLYAQPQLVPNVTLIRGTDVGELRGAIDALRYAVHLAPQFGGSVPATGYITAAHFTALVIALNDARREMGAADFTYSGVPAPLANGYIFGQHVQQLREALR